MSALSILLRGTVTEKLQWTFNLYDINRDGYINKEVCRHAYLYIWLLQQQFKITYFIAFVSTVLTGDDRHCQSDLRHDGEVHLPCPQDGHTQAARRGLFSGKELYK